MDDASSPTALDQAAQLAAWLIREKRTAPKKAIYIASRKHHVDRHEVARRLGRYGGRRRSEVPPQGREPLPIPPTSATLAPVATVPVSQTWCMDLLVSALEPHDSGALLHVVPAEGLFAGERLTYAVGQAWLTATKPGDHLRFRVEYASGEGGGLSSRLLECVAVYRVAAVGAGT